MMSTVALAVSAVALGAQAPNFTGKWTMVPDPNAAAAGGRGGFGGFGQEFTATQDANTLTITRTTQNGETKSVYNLDGSDSKNTTQGRNGAQEVVSQAKWDSGKLNISTTRDFGGTPSTTVQSLSMDASGNLVVSTTAPGRNGGDPTTRVTTYKKG
jgi:hypothetical protein